jgi:flavin-dependent dehydrogenase
MIGDTAGLIHPLCGNGMAMAIHSAKIVSESINNYYNRVAMSRETFENSYAKEWNKQFKSRLKTGQTLANLLLKPKVTDILFYLLTIAPFLLPMIIKRTHGKPIIVN